MTKKKKRTDNTYIKVLTAQSRNRSCKNNENNKRKKKAYGCKNPTLRKEFALAVVFISPIMNEITIRISPVKKWTKRTTFCV